MGKWGKYLKSALQMANLSPLLGTGFSERQFTDALEVYEIQEPTLHQAYLDRWAGTLGVADLRARVRRETARPPEET
jgi:hypothetical protein